MTDVDDNNLFDYLKNVVLLLSSSPVFVFLFHYEFRRFPPSPLAVREEKIFCLTLHSNRVTNISFKQFKKLAFNIIIIIGIGISIVSKSSREVFECDR